jgi:hypothetical protein
VDQRERQAREAEARRVKFVRDLQNFLISYGDPEATVRGLPMLALMVRYERVSKRLRTTTPGEERGCLD